ncbi:hypothetical protein L596_023005 [Steinernema carpocapsae]|uniref:G-protein coupled receptors family 1 profile domain-containing protein n=1 Tax=Steinernema carpocapsae TaxID=34508 RepID=A0A4U5MCA2_STECR|nr:hypothetical protein L596_023005 [Steinernema carpocapsae]
MPYGTLSAAISIVVIAVFGLFGNANIILAILRKRDLRTKSGCLMCLIAMYDTISIVFEIWTAKRLFGEEILVKRYCFHTVVPYFVILVTQTYTLMALAIDRLIAIFYPMRYRRISTSCYVAFAFFPGALIGISFSVLAEIYMDHETVAFCNPPMSLPTVIESVYRSYTVAMNLAIIVLYGISLYALQRQKRLLNTIRDVRHSRHIQHQQQIMRTIGVIMMVFVSAFFLIQLVNFIIIYADIDEKLPAIEFIRGMSIVPIMVTFSQSFYVYWWRSLEYRSVFKEQLKLVFPFLPFEKSSNIVPTNSRTVFRISN